MKLVLFDCDGTLVDSGGLIHEVMARTFVHYGLERPDYAKTRSIIGLTLDIAIARVMDQNHVDERVQAMTRHYKDIYGDVRREAGFQEPLYDGISTLLGNLAKRDDLILGAVTGKSRKGLDLICDTHGFKDMFFVSRTADDCPSKPHPAMVLECCHHAGIDPRDTLVIGDAIYDMEMAAAAGARAIGVSWGYGETEALAKAGAFAVVNHPVEIAALL